MSMLQVGREETEKRLKVLQRLRTMQVDEERLTLEIQKYKDSDPEMLEQMKNEIQVFFCFLQQEISSVLQMWNFECLSC